MTEEKDILEKAKQHVCDCYASFWGKGINNDFTSSIIIAKEGNGLLINVDKTAPSIKSIDKERFSTALATKLKNETGCNASYSPDNKYPVSIIFEGTVEDLSKNILEKSNIEKYGKSNNLSERGV